MNNTITNEEKVIRNGSLDILKFFSSYMVICIHFLFYGRVGNIIDALARFAVPVFFMTSGYFSYANNTEKLKKKMIHIIKIYLYGFALYFCFYACYNMISNGIQGVTEYFVSYFQMKKIVIFLMFNSPNSSVHLWFLSALLYCYMIQYCVTKWGIKDKMLFGLSISFLVLHLILGVGLSAVGKVVPVPIVRNFLLMGYPFFCFGMMLRKKEVTILRIVTNKIAVYLLIVGLTETLISYLISGKNELYLGSIIVAFALFVIALNMRHILYSKAIIKLSQTSTIIYIIHILVGKCLSLTTLRETGLWRCASPIIVCVFSTLIALMVNELLCFEKRIQTKRCFWGK